MGQRWLTSLWLLLVSHVFRCWKRSKRPSPRLLEKLSDKGVTMRIFDARVPAGVVQPRLDLRRQRLRDNGGSDG